MSATKRYAEMGADGEERLSRRPCGWKLSYEKDGEKVEVDGCTDWDCTSPFGSVSGRVVMGPEGPIYDRPEYREAPSVHAVVWGFDPDNNAKFAVLRQPRPYADDPESLGKPNEPVVFGQIVMGFLERIIGKDFVTRFETPEDGASREASEEAGVQVVISVEKPPLPRQNANPTFMPTWTEIVFVQVDLDRIEALKEDRNEPIFSAEFISAKELRDRIRDGRDEHGAVYRMCTSNSAWFTFFCCHPELFL